MWFEALPEMLACVMVFGIPLAAILTSHQRKMAEIIHGRKHQQLESAEVAQRRAEMAQLRDRVNQLTLIVDGLNRSVSVPPESPLLSDRIR